MRGGGVDLWCGGVKEGTLVSVELWLWMGEWGVGGNDG